MLIGELHGFFTPQQQTIARFQILRQSCHSVQELRDLAEKKARGTVQMAKTVPVIGLDSSELGWVRLLVFLLRHPDPVIPQLTRQAILHIETIANGAASPSDTLDHAG